MPWQEISCYLSDVVYPLQKRKIVICTKENFNFNKESKKTNFKLDLLGENRNFGCILTDSCNKPYQLYVFYGLPCRLWYTYRKKPRIWHWKNDKSWMIWGQAIDLKFCVKGVKILLDSILVKTSPCLFITVFQVFQLSIDYNNESRLAKVKWTVILYMKKQYSVST